MKGRSGRRVQGGTSHKSRLHVSASSRKSKESGSISQKRRNLQIVSRKFKALFDAMKKRAIFFQWSGG
jgi:hypothetical protein